MEEKLIEIVKDVGKLLIKNFGKVKMVKRVKIKNPYDYSISIDLLAEKEILKKLKEAKIRCSVITEERGRINLGIQIN
jgi:fructose-1,6-bisphosphatase/inositol monophosphatase family enzyme